MTPTRMKHFLRSAVLVSALLFLPVLVFVRFMEASNRFDSLGWWYSVYVAIAFSVPTGLLVASGVYLATKFRGNRA